MRRIISVLAVMAIVAAMAVAMAMPAFADKGGVPNGGISDQAEFCHAFGKFVGAPPGECTRQH